jgi:hypothetical protein
VDATSAPGLAAADFCFHYLGAAVEEVRLPSSPPPRAQAAQCRRPSPVTVRRRTHTCADSRAQWRTAAARLGGLGPTIASVICRRLLRGSATCSRCTRRAWASSAGAAKPLGPHAPSGCPPCPAACVRACVRLHAACVRACACVHAPCACVCVFTARVRTHVCTSARTCAESRAAVAAKARRGRSISSRSSRHA